jgi:hypothetical protein
MVYNLLFCVMAVKRTVVTGQWLDVDQHISHFI